jgi:DNA primase
VRRTAAAPLREATLVVALANHPELIEEYFETVAGLELSHPELRRLHAALLDALAHGTGDDRGRLVTALGEAGLAEAFARAVSLVKSARQWPALADAALDDARDAFVQALHLHLGARSLHRELKAAEAALAAEPTDENYRHMLDVQAQLRAAQATDALIEGFGVSSGRAGR